MRPDLDAGKQSEGDGTGLVSLKKGKIQDSVTYPVILPQATAPESVPLEMAKAGACSVATFGSSVTLNSFEPLTIDVD